MTVFIVLALLASNIVLAKMLLSKDNKKPDVPSAVDENIISEAPAEDNNAPDLTNPLDEKIASVVGESKYDPDTYKQIVQEVVKEVVPLIIEEYGNYADAGFPEPPVSKDTGVIPVEKLDEVFSNQTVADITGEAPEPAEPRADGIDFNDINTTMNVLTEKSDSPEDMEIAKRTLQELEGTTIKEEISLDPAIKKRIMLIELHLPEKKEEPVESSVSPTEEDKTEIQQSKPKKILFHADIDTSDIDEIDFNVYH